MESWSEIFLKSGTYSLRDARVASETDSNHLYNIKMQ